MDQGMNRYLREWYDRHTDEVVAMMQDLWEHPELSLHEYHAARTMGRYMEEQGFRVEYHAAEDYDNPQAQPNTVIASWGEGEPVIGIIGEMDALPGLGQQAVPYRAPIEGPGHGCGHNLMAAGAAGAAAAVKYAMEKEGLKGTVRLIETPAEEIGCGKALLAKNGVFKGLDMALMWHPFQIYIHFERFTSLAIYGVTFEFEGKAAHASAAPENGRNALDALQLMNMGMEFLREHVPDSVWMHYYIKDGGDAPNVVPEHASAEYLLRAPDGEVIQSTFQRMLRVAEGAAMMTDTKMKYTVTSAGQCFYMNRALHRYVYEASRKVDPIVYTPEEYAYGRQLMESVTGKPAPEDDDKVLITRVLPYTDNVRQQGCCTDAAEMSHFCPTIHFWGGGRLFGMPSHHWCVTSVMGMSIGQKAGLYAYKVIAQAAYDALTNPQMVKDCWADFEAQHIPPYQPRM